MTAQQSAEYMVGTSSAGQPAWGSAWGSACDEKRIALDGFYYTEHQFQEWYGDNHLIIWNQSVAESPQEAVSMPAQEASASISVAKPDSSQEVLSTPALQCPACKRELCQTRELCWFYRRNDKNGVEVHLMLRPEVPMPQMLVPATEAKQGAAKSWQCGSEGCGTEIGDSRAVGPRKAMMTAFKSSKVMLYGQRHTGKKSMWPRIYNTPPFNNIQVRTRDTFHGVP